MVERYARDASREANDDIAEVVYGVSDEHVSVTCHREDSKISATTRHFAKPALTDDKGASGVVWNTDSYSAFLVYDTHARTHTQTDLHDTALTVSSRSTATRHSSYTTHTHARTRAHTLLLWPSRLERSSLRPPRHY